MEKEIRNKHMKYACVEASMVILVIVVWELCFLIKWGYKPNEMILIYLLWWGVFSMLSLPKLDQNIDGFFNHMIRFLVYPLAFIFFVIYGFIIRKKLRWLKSKWYCVSMTQLWKFMLNDSSVKY